MKFRKLAFPCDKSSYSLGMDLEDWFAGQVLPAIYQAYANQLISERVSDEYKEEIEETIAACAYGIAHQMMKMRGNTTND